MPAPFAADLCGYRLDKDDRSVITQFPNTSDRNDDLSVRLGQEMLREMGVDDGVAGPHDPGAALEVRTIQHLQELRPDLHIQRSKAVRDFIQYGHLGVTADFIKLYRKSAKSRLKLLDRIESASDSAAGQEPAAARRRRQKAFQSLRALLDEEVEAFEYFTDQVPREDLLNVDITLATDIGAPLPELRVALSAKWSLRTDRGQDGVSQGSKLASQKRGRMPHFALITAEPRPAMLKIPSDGPSMDCVYHINLPALDRALTTLADGNPRWSPKVTFDRLVRQGRLRDYDDLVKQVKEIPRPMDEKVPATETVEQSDG